MDILLLLLSLEIPLFLKTDDIVNMTSTRAIDLLWFYWWDKVISDVNQSRYDAMSEVHDICFSLRLLYIYRDYLLIMRKKKSSFSSNQTFFYKRKFALDI